MKIRLLILASFTLSCIASLAVAQQRQMNVTQGPDQVFSRSVAVIFPLLQTSSATNENGRVGNELVFWGYQLNDGNTAWLYACANLEGVDCEARIQSICPAGKTDVIASGVEPVKLRELSCTAVRAVGIGELRPGCTDTTSNMDMMVGIAQCP